MGLKCSGRQSRPSAEIFAPQKCSYGAFAPPHRRRKVRLSPFPPHGKNYDRSLAPPLPTRPAAAGLGRGTPVLGLRGLFHSRRAKQSGPLRGPAGKLAALKSVLRQSGSDNGHGIAPTKCPILRGPVGIKMLRAAKPPFRRDFCSAKMLVRRFRAAPSAMGPRGLFHGRESKTKRAPKGARRETCCLEISSPPERQ